VKFQIGLLKQIMWKLVIAIMDARVILTGFLQMVFAALWFYFTFVPVVMGV
jgi:hypothetical protein